MLKNLMVTSSTLLVLLLTAAFHGFAKAPTVLTLRGAIMDSQCAYNVHSINRSHESMVSKGVFGAKDDISCTLHCVRDQGGSYVLLVNDEVYKLDDQALPEPFSGKRVKVSAALDQKTHVLHVLKMEEER